MHCLCDDNGSTISINYYPMPAGLIEPAHQKNSGKRISNG